MTELRPAPRPREPVRPPRLAAEGPAPWCDVLEPALRERLRRRLPGFRLTLRAPGDAVEAPLLLCGLTTLEGWLRGAHPGRLFGSWHTLVIAARPSPELTARILDAGADGVLDEAEPRAVLAARLRAHDRRHLAGPDAVRPVGPWRLDPLRRTARHVDTGRRERLTHVELSILRRLSMGAGAVVRDEAMKRDVFGYRPTVVSHTLETHVYRLRRKLEADPSRPRLIVRASGGYRLETAGA